MITVNVKDQDLPIELRTDTRVTISLSLEAAVSLRELLDDAAVRVIKDRQRKARGG